MIKYFISYKNLMNDNKLNKVFDIYSPELKIVKKNKDNTYRVEPILYFNGYAKDVISLANKITSNNRGISLMVELTKEEIKDINPLFVKKMETKDDKKFKLSNEQEREIKLINYNCFTNMTSVEINSSKFHKIVIVENVGGKNKRSISVLNDYNFFEKREDLLKSGLGNDIYFYTDDEIILERYKDDLTIFKEIDFDEYELNSQRLLVIDSIPQERLYDVNTSTMRLLYQICNNSIPINISENEDKYDISINKLDKRNKKAYLITRFNIKNLLYDTSILPLLKYINIFELDNGSYKKINIEDYMKDRDTLKEMEVKTNKLNLIKNLI